MKSVFSVAVPALLLMSATAFAADQTPAQMQPSGGKSDQTLSAGTGGLQGSQTGEGNMNGPNGDGSAGNGKANMSSSTSSSMTASSGSGNTMTSPSVSATAELSASADTSPTYQGGRRAYRGKSERSLNASEAQETAQLNQEQSQFSSK
jgi:hypothetical protein